MSETFRIATFNLQYGQVWDSNNPDRAPYDLNRAIGEIERLDADIVLLQEMERVEPEKGQVQPPPNFTRLRDALPCYHAVFEYPPEDSRELPFGYGLAILSKTPLSDVQPISLPAPELTFEFMGEMTGPTDRLLLAAKTEIAGRTLQIFNAHLQAFFIINYSSDDFRCQRDVVEEILRASRLPTVLGGDMNSAPGESIVEQFAKAGFQTAQRSKVTWKRRPYVLDHLFYNTPLEVLEQEVVRTDAADHDILVATLRFRDEA
jgi:endonuclease/exonuclease/phosphatase family metal-dependent hydrolase